MLVFLVTDTVSCAFNVSDELAERNLAAAPFWLAEYRRMRRNGLAASAAWQAIVGQTPLRIDAIARVIAANSSRTPEQARSAAWALLAASLETGIPVAWLMATGYYESRWNKAAIGAPVVMRSGPYAGRTVNACGPGQLLWPYSGPYTDTAWTGPQTMNREAPPMSCQGLTSDERQAWRMTARMFRRLMFVSQGPNEGYRKAIGWYSAGSAWAGTDGQDYRAKHQAKMGQMQTQLDAAGLR